MATKSFYHRFIEYKSNGTFFEEIKKYGVNCLVFKLALTIKIVFNSERNQQNFIFYCFEEFILGGNKQKLITILIFLNLSKKSKKATGFFKYNA